MRLRITYEFDITDIPSVGAVQIEDSAGNVIARGDSLQQTLDTVSDFLTRAGGFVTEDGFTFDIVDVNPSRDGLLIKRETALVRSLNKYKRGIDFTPLTEALEKLKQSVKREGYDPS